LPEPLAAIDPHQAPTPPPNTFASAKLDTGEAVDKPIDGDPVSDIDQEIEIARATRRRLDKERKMIEGMYCPCPGFAYNSLAGEKNVLVC